MGGQHKKALSQGDKKHRADNDGNHPEYLARDTRDEIQGNKAGDIGKDAEGHGHDYFTGPTNCRLQGRDPLLAVSVEVLSYHNGIINHNSQCNNESEKRNHVYGDTGRRQKQEGPQERDGNTHHNPECDPGLEKCSQQENHKHQTHSPVLQQQPDALAVDVGPVVEDRELNTGRKPWFDFLKLSFDCIGHLGGGLFAYPINFQHHGRLPVILRIPVTLLKRIFDRGDVSQENPAPVPAGDNR